MRKHKLAGKTVKIVKGRLAGNDYRVEDLWININNGVSWGDSVGNPACHQYAIRAAMDGLPPDDDVLYGKIGAFGYLVHESEIGDETPQKED